MHDDSQISIYRLSGEFIMFAELKTKTHALPTSRVQEAEKRRLAGQRKRLNNKLAETEARSALNRIIDVDHVQELTATTTQSLEHQAPDDALDMNQLIIDAEYKEQQITLDELLADVGDDETTENNYEL